MRARHEMWAVGGWEPCVFAPGVITPQESAVRRHLPPVVRADAAAGSAAR